MIVSAGNYTFGHHPDENGQSIKTWSDPDWNDQLSDFYEKRFFYVTSEDVREIGEARGLVRIKLNNQDRVIFSLFKSGVTDNIGRPGIFSHHLSVGLDEYIEAGADPDLFEKHFLKTADDYVAFVRAAKAKGSGLVEPLKIQVEESGQNNYRLDFINKNTLKKIISCLFKKEKLYLVCPGRDPNTIIKIVYALLKLLPPNERVIPFCTMPVRKNVSDFDLIAGTPGSFENGWRAIDIDKEINFTPEDNIDQLARYIVDGYENGDAFIKGYLEVWKFIYKKSNDTETNARSFVSQVIIHFSPTEDLINKSKIYLEKGKTQDAEIQAQEMLYRAKKENNTSIKIQYLLSAFETLSRAKDTPKGVIEAFDQMMSYATNLGPEDLLQILAAITERFPDKKNEVVQHYESKVGNNAFGQNLEYLHKNPNLISKDSAEKLIRQDNFENFKFYVQTACVKEYLREIDPKKMLNDLSADIPTQTPSYKALLLIHKKISNLMILRDEEFESIVKQAITKSIDALGEVTKKGFFGAQKFDEEIPLEALAKIFLSNTTVLLLFLTDDFNLKDYSKKLKELTVAFIDTLFTTVSRNKEYDPAKARLDRTFLGDKSV